MGKIKINKDTQNDEYNIDINNKLYKKYFNVSQKISRYCIDY